MTAGLQDVRDIPVTVTIRDTVTGETYKSPLTEFGTYWWTEGNGSCDCNRGKNPHDADLDLPCTHTRYRIVAVDPLINGYTLDDFNKGYPKETPA